MLRNRLQNPSTKHKYHQNTTRQHTPTSKSRRFRRLAYPCLAFLAILTTIFTPLTITTHATTCPDIQVIFARGSGESLDGPSFTAYKKALSSTFELYAPSLTLSYYELGSIVRDGAQYPAVALDNIKILASTAVSMGEDYAFGDSINQGITELTSFINTTTTSCPDTKIVLSGYSAGAMVISKTLLTLEDKSKILAATTIGDPKLYLPEGLVTVAGTTPPACRGRNISKYRINVPDCTVSAGILGGLTLYASGYGNSVGTWCHSSDPVCGSFPSISKITSGELLTNHTNYISDTTYPEVAEFTLKLAKATFGDRISDSVDTTIRSTSIRDTAIVIDTTGSMGSLFDQYKTEALKVAKTTIDSGGRIALYEYRDEISGETYSPRQLCDFSCTYEEFSTKLDSLAVEGGGDEPESALSALLHAMNELSWQQGATKSIVLLTDATYHSTDIGGITLPDIVRRSREIDPVNIYVLTNSSVSDFYEDLTTETGGKIFLNTDGFEASTTYLLTRPVARLMMEHYYSYPGEGIYFNAFASTSDNPVDHYEWDLDFDGKFEVSCSTPEALKFYSYPTSGTIQFKIVDTYGQSSTMTAEVTVMNRGLSIPTITSHTVDQSTSTPIIQLTTENTSLLSIRSDDKFLGFTADNTITLTDLPTTNFNLQLTPIGENGVTGETLEIYLNGVPKNTATLRSTNPTTSDSIEILDLPDYSDIYNTEPLDKLLNTPSSTFSGLRAPNAGYNPQTTSTRISPDHQNKVQIHAIFTPVITTFSAKTIDFSRQVWYNSIIWSKTSPQVSTSQKNAGSANSKKSAIPLAKKLKSPPQSLATTTAVPNYQCISATMVTIGTSPPTASTNHHINAIALRPPPQHLIKTSGKKPP